MGWGVYQVEGEDPPEPRPSFLPGAHGHLPQTPAHTRGGTVQRALVNTFILIVVDRNAKRLTKPWLALYLAPGCLVGLRAYSQGVEVDLATG